MSEHRHLIRSASIITALTALSRVFGYIRDARIAFLLGTGLEADAYNVAYRIPNLLRRLVGEGAVSAAFIPIFSKYLSEDQREEAWRFANSLLVLLTIVLTAVTVLGIVFSPFLVWLLAGGFEDSAGKTELTAALNRVMFPYILLISLSALAMGVLNSFKKFAAPAFAPVLLNLAVIAFSFLTPWFETPEMALSVGVVVGGILQLAIQLIPMYRVGWRPELRMDLSHPGVRRAGKLMIPVTFGVGIVQLNFIVGTQFASRLQEGSVTALSYSDRVMELVLGGYAIALATAVLPTMSYQAAQRRFDEMRTTLNFATRLILFITLPSTIGLIVLREEIIEVLFQRGDFDAASTALTAFPLLFYAIGLSAFSMMKIIVPAFYAIQDTRTPVRVAFAAMILNVILNFVFFHPLGVGGPALAQSLAAFFNALVLMVIFRRRHGRFGIRNIIQSFGKFLLAAAALGVVAALVIQWPGFYKDQSQAQKIFALTATIAAAAGTYFAMVFLLRSREIGELREVFARRRGQRRVD